MICCDLGFHFFNNGDMVHFTMAKSLTINYYSCTLAKGCHLRITVDIYNEKEGGREEGGDLSQLLKYSQFTLHTKKRAEMEGLTHNDKGTV